ncbi:MAG: glycosyltransferase family 2 protein [Sulfuricurvum sp.]|uniref:glycosyltransferase n=1 Tax=Sulfuricurvum sp. TaxID=2025608 RepID=UPI00273750E4|nr:glycosyltransferase family 2 protein [Sulfuricurvum sp.]MDP2850911.1 glycosyltransferase family 2 protein [Sulfuricurvum sp.]
MDKVSIIIPTRNRSSYLERALEHAFAQDYPDFEVIVSNNASTDDTAHVLESLKTKYPNLISVHHPELLPLSTHWDKVIRDVSTGNIILLIPDDDVIIDKCYLSKAVRLFEKYPSIGLVFANFCSINPQFQRITNYEAKFDEFIPKEFLFNNYNKELFGITGIGVPHLTALFSRKAYLDVGGFDLDCMSPDTYLWLKILLKYDAGFVNEIVAEYLMHENNLSKKANIDQFYSDTLIPQKIQDLAQSIGSIDRNQLKTIKRMYEIFYRRYINITCPKGSWKRAYLKFLLKFK